jgi:tetratricopeptide (TPR) repeat protein
MLVAAVLEEVKQSATGLREALPNGDGMSCTAFQSIGTSFLLTLCLAACPMLAFAGTKILTAEGTYVMGDGETPLLAEARALQQAKQTALEQAGTYVSSYSRTKNADLTDDEIETVSAGVMHVEILEKKRSVIGDGFVFSVKISATVSTDQIDLLVERLRENRGEREQLVHDYKNLKAQFVLLSQEIDALKRGLTETDSVSEKERIRNSLTSAERRYLARQRYEEIENSSINSMDFASLPISTLIQWLTEVITIDPTFSDAWRTRGSWYQWQEDYKRAIEDYSQAIRHNPLDDNSWAHRGFSYGELGQFDQAVADLNKSIRLNPSYVHLKDRMYIYEKFGHYDKALQDQNAILRILPCSADEYGHRGEILWKLFENQTSDKGRDQFITKLAHTTAIQTSLQGRHPEVSSDTVCKGLEAGGLEDLLKE